MRYKKLKVTSVLLLGLGLSSIHGQNIYVKENFGTQTVYPLSSIQKITFPSGNLTITKTDNSNSVYTLNTLRYLNFQDLSHVMEEHSNYDNNLLVYPNPVYNELTIDLSCTKKPKGIIRILNIEGRLMLTQSIGGSDILTFDISEFPSGIYICLYVNGTEIKSTKIIKK